MLEDSGEGQTCNLTTKLSRLASRRFKKRQRGERKEPIEELTRPGKDRQQSTRTLALNDGPGWARGAQSHGSLKMVLIVDFIFRR